MKLNDKKTLREKSVIDLRKHVEALRKEMMISKMQHSVGKLTKPHLIKKLRVEVAIAQTIIGEKEKVQA